MLTKAQLVDSVVDLNPSARREWLGQFGAEQLQIYLERLRHAQSPRGSRSAWLRRPALRVDPVADLRAA